jgi:two-component system, cell cycle sensor histidine kinase and response regulator CckA
MGGGGRIELHARNIVLQDSEESRSGPHVSIAIRDYGPGIDDSVLSRIFDPYFSGKQGGSGLGLATAYAIVSKHHGRIQVESKIGEGTVFTIELPASEQITVAEVAQARPRRGHGRLLVMDDENSVRTLADRVLTSLGYEVRSASDGAEAVALYQAERNGGRTFDAVLLDLTVTGGMGGIEAAARLRELDPSVKLIVSSGYSDSAVMSNFREYGFIAVVPKPWNPTLLSEVIGSVLTDKSERTPD